jgi:hypothetical protein
MAMERCNELEGRSASRRDERRVDDERERVRRLRYVERNQRDHARDDDRGLNNPRHRAPGAGRLVAQSRLTLGTAPERGEIVPRDPERRNEHNGEQHEARDRATSDHHPQFTALRPASQEPGRPGVAGSALSPARGQGVSAIATPQGKVPQGILATTVFELVSITASSLARPTVA